MSILGKKLLQLLNNPSKRKGNEKTVIVPFDQAQHLGILFTWTDTKKEAALEAFVEKLGADKKVDVLCFNPNKESVNSQYPILQISDLTALGKFNSEVTQYFLRQPFDFIFHFDFEMNEITKSILVMTKAKCRVGFHSKEGAKYYELMIGINKSAGITNFAEQIEKYVKAIR